jgi:hypothetical protein
MFPFVVAFTLLAAALVAALFFGPPREPEEDKIAEEELPPRVLTWKPVRYERIDWQSPSRGYVTETDDEIVIHTLFYSEDSPVDTEGLEACTDFTLDDLEAGVSVLGGCRTAGYFSIGVITAWKEGKYFNFDGPNEGSLLWNNLILLRGPLADRVRDAHQRELAAAERRYRKLATMDIPDGAGTPPLGSDDEGEIPPAGPCRRTDSGTNYGFYGTPDWAFWKRSGYQLFWRVEAQEYSYGGGGDASETYPARLREMVKRLGDGNYETDLEREALEEHIAWLNQQVQAEMEEDDE